MRRLPYLLVGITCLLASGVPARAATSRVDGTADEVEAAPGRLRLAQATQAAQAARIDSISPTSARRGQTVAITGIGFGGRNVRIAVGGVPAEVLAATGNAARFRVPANAPGGPTTVTATNPGGHTGSIGFRVLGQPPLADAGPDQLVTVQTTVELDGGGSRDPDGDPLTFRWSFVTLPARSRATLSDPTAMRPSFIIDLPGRYVARLIVNDGTANSPPDTVVIDTHDSQPVANAGPDQIVFVLDTVELAGSGAIDPDKSGPGFAWSFLSVPSGSLATLSDPTAARPMFTPDLPGTYLVRLVVNDGTADSAPAGVTITVGLIQLPGPPGDRASSHIPQIEFPDPMSQDLVDPNGLPTSVHDLIVIFQDSATVADVNAVLLALPAGIVGGVPEAHLLLLRLAGPSDLDRVLNAQQALLSNPVVLAATINTGMSPSGLPPHNVDGDRTLVPPITRWTWEVPLDGASGNWGVKAIRMPQAWNLVDFATRQNARIDAAVLEADETPGRSAASSSHPDLFPRINNPLLVLPSNHATMVAGIIGAIWDDNAGVEGVYPRNITIVSRPSSFTGSLLSSIFAVLRTTPDVRVLNASYGYNYSTAPATTPVNPAVPGGLTVRDQRNLDGNVLLLAVQVEQLFAPREFLMFCGAGNQRRLPVFPLLPPPLPSPLVVEGEARDESACANVAARAPSGPDGVDHFLAIEAMDSAGFRSDWTALVAPGWGSASGGTVSAPGTCVRSTEFNEGVNNDRGGCTGTDATDQSYATQIGTSFATPYAAGVAAYLWSLDPGLTHGELRQIMTDSQNTVPVYPGPLGGPAGAWRIDAFAAAMGIDVFHGNRTLQRRLVDVNDGTPDGNQRTIRADDGSVGTPHTFIATPDGRRGDGRVSMQDFRAFRDAVVQVLLDKDVGGLAAADVDLDGPPTHFKKDLNLDGCVGQQVADPPHPPTGTVPRIPVPPQGCGQAPKENVFPRYDFNGDGSISERRVPNSDSGFLAFKGNVWTDLDVLANLWANPPAASDLNEGWSAAELLDLLPPPVGLGGSGDIEFRTHLPLGGANTIDEITLTHPQLRMTRFIGADNTCAGSTCIVWTVPITTEPILFEAEGLKGGNKVSDLCFGAPVRPDALRHGEDRVVAIVSCAPPGNGTFSVYSYAFAYIHEQLAGESNREGESYEEQPIGGWPPGDGLLGVAATEASANVTDKGFPAACPVHGSASAEGRASLGVLSGSATAHADVDRFAPPGYLTGLCPKDTNNLERSARGDAWTSDGWKDTLTIVDTSGTLPAGTPVNLEMGVSATGNAASGSFFAYRVDPTTGRILSTLAQIFQGVEQLTARINTFVGDTIAIVGSITVRVAADTGGLSNPSVTSSDSVVAQFHVDLDPLTPGASYTSASGQTYFSQ